jgi:HTH-type transcriptional regulator, transcriptional repressor of NAD biosynthesis genes
MKKGLVLGKFMPLHQGHLSLINFAVQRCDQLYVLLCHTPGEPIAGNIREQWLRKTFENIGNIIVVSFNYDSSVLPNTSVSSREVSRQWASAISNLLGPIDIVFSSEPYGDYIAEYMGAVHHSFDEKRTIVPVSASVIRENPFLYWDYMPAYVRSWYVKKICIVGSESTGKSTLTEKLAQHFNTSFVPEMARDIIEKTSDVILEDLDKIAHLHAEIILEKLPMANKLLFIDTDLNITMSYASHLFSKTLMVPSWIMEANRCDLYLYLETDCDYVQDGTRVSKEEREKLGLSHKEQFKKAGINLVFVSGNWEKRTNEAISIVRSTFLNY